MRRLMFGARTLFSLALVLAAFTGSAAAQSKTFKVDSKGGSAIQFVSTAPMETFTGRSTALSGEFTVDPAKLDKGKGDVRVEVASIKTNQNLRDEHLAGENWLDAKKYPQARFQITKITGASALKPNDVTEVTVSGKFTLHGVTKDITTKAKVRYTPGDKPSLRVQSTFNVNWEDYKVAPPSYVWLAVKLKVAHEIVVNVDIKATAG
jgi:polyisoprenoid-binding protein YceI